MINVFVPYFFDSVAERAEEVFRCFLNNHNNKSIDKLYLVSEDARVKNIQQDAILIRSRPTYNVMFDIANEVTKDDDWNFIINSDIYFDETINFIKKYDNSHFIALSRWDVDEAGRAVLFDRWDSQDAWAFKGKAKEMNADFYQGKAGCDNAIAARALHAGYKVINPSKTIKTYHLHNTGIRNYNPSDRVPKPYHLINPHE